MNSKSKYLPTSCLFQPANLPRLKCGGMTSLSPSQSQSKTIKLFSVPATLCNTDPAIIFTLLHQCVEHQAVLHQTFLTALELDCVSIPWEQARLAMVPGLKARVDITQVRQSSTEYEWLVFGLYLDTAIMSQTDQVTVGVMDGFISNWMTSRGKDEPVSDGFITSQSDSEDEYLEQGLNQTFTVDEEPYLHDQVRCDHKYEVGVVVVTISSQFLHLTVQCGDTWSRADVDPLDSLVFVEGIRTKEVFSIKMGAMGHMVTKKCVKCQLDKTSAVDLSPILLWFGEKRCPSVREQSGVVVGRKGDRVVVQMEDSDIMVLFHGEIIKEELEIDSKVLVWAWSKILRGGAGSFLEGAAVIVQEDIAEEDTAGEVAGDDTYDMLELSTDGIFSPIRSKFDEMDDYLLNLSSTYHKDDMDVSLSVSFGSVSGQSDDGKENFSTMVNPDCSSNYMEDVSLRDDLKKVTNDFLDEIYFQSLFWRSSSPKPDAIIDAQFNNILSANDLLHNYDDLVTDYDQMTTADTTKFQADLRSPSLCLTPDLSKRQERAPALPAFLTMSKSFTRSLSHTPLSPIPEETTADREASDHVDDPVFTAVGPDAASTPTGRFSIDGAGCPVIPDSHGQLPTAMDSGYYDSFSSGLNTNDLSGNAKFAWDVLEQFLEFTKFPSVERCTIINSFLTHSDVEEI